jgi:mRNA interferase YafQ
MREVILTSSFKKDYKRLKRSARHDMGELQVVVEQLSNGKPPLDQKYCDHSLIGNLNDCRECHIRPDWLLIYRLNENDLVLVRTGSHSDLF